MNMAVGTYVNGFKRNGDRHRRTPGTGVFLVRR
jgi:hypothetical protein